MDEAEVGDETKLVRVYEFDWPGTAGARAPLGLPESDRVKPEPEAVDPLTEGVLLSGCDQLGDGNCGDDSTIGVATA